MITSFRYANEITPLAELQELVDQIQPTRQDQGNGERRYSVSRIHSEWTSKAFPYLGSLIIEDDWIP